jgi:hypothetical protein
LTWIMNTHVKKSRSQYHLELSTGLWIQIGTEQGQSMIVNYHTTLIQEII